MKALVLDLRFDPGGLLSSAVEVADLFLPKEDVIVSTKREREPQQLRVYRSEHEPLLTKGECPMAVLVNSGSASGSEILAAALQENGRAIVVGAKTYGKGSVQTVRTLKDKSALKITAAYYYTPTGKLLTGEGIEPDIPIVLSKEDDRRLRQQLPDDRAVVTAVMQGDDTAVTEVEDVQLKEAVTVLRGYVILAAQEKPLEEEPSLVAESPM
jgi:carboxyl-terminal processing protease